MRFLFIIAAFALLFVAMPVQAQDDGAPPRWSLLRLGAGIEGGYALLRDDSDADPNPAGFVRLPVSYNMGRLSFVAAGQAVMASGASPRYAGELGIRGHLIGTSGDDGDRFNIALGAGYMILAGSGYDQLEAKFNATNDGQMWSEKVLAVSARMGNVLVVDDNGRGILGLKIWAESIPANTLLNIYGAIGYQFLGG